MQDTKQQQTIASLAHAIQHYIAHLGANGDWNEALQLAESSKATLAVVVSSEVTKDPEIKIKYIYDMALLDKVIGLIKSKMDDLQGAIDAYEEAVCGFREIEGVDLESPTADTIRKQNLAPQHLGASLGLIACLKQQLGDALSVDSKTMSEYEGTSTSLREEEAEVAFHSSATRSCSGTSSATELGDPEEALSVDSKTLSEYEGTGPATSLREEEAEVASHSSATKSRSENSSATEGEEICNMMEEEPPLDFHADALSSTADLLVDPQFIRRRVETLGAIEATTRHVADLLELRRVVDKSVPSTPAESPSGETFNHISANAVMRKGSRRIIDECYRVVATASSGPSDSLTMAICLSCVGEGLLEYRQPRDAVLRLEEAVGMYRELLGPFHIEVARSLDLVAKALVKLGEKRVALLKFWEAARIYESCNAHLHVDSIANSQSIVNLLVDVGDWDKAEDKFVEVISMKKAVDGETNVSVAKALKSHATLLAKHRRMDDALRHYESSKAAYAAVARSDPEFDLEWMYDVTLIYLNVASIKSKKGDLRGAIESYEEGVRGLREYEEAAAGVPGKSRSHDKHLVFALSSMGYLKLKLGDIEGALEAYVALLYEVGENSPTASKTEKAKAHIQCATIYRQLAFLKEVEENNPAVSNTENPKAHTEGITICRQLEAKDAHDKSTMHLREALEMYTMLFGVEHKDTQGLASSLRQWLSES